MYKHGKKEVLPRAALVKADSSPLEMPALVCRAQLCVFPISLTLVNHPAISKHTGQFSPSFWSTES